jgi:glycosidase
MKTSWIEEAFFYHIYPLGLCGAPQRNNLNLPVEPRLDTLYPWLDHIQGLGANAIYLGPVFQSTSHGYDTIDYYQVDRRLGNNDALARFSDAVHQYGMQLVLDGVFNHVGRDFWAFKDVLERGENSPYQGWFSNLRFGERSPKGDPFQYESWGGHYSLVKLNLQNQHVRDHIFDAVRMWMDKFGIDGLRLDAADCIDFDFLRALHGFTKSRNPEFWLLGEVVHGDYRQWVNSTTLDSVTNYSAYKGLYSSLNDANYFEIAHGLDQQFGENGQYQDLFLYNFVDNHDVDRVASKLKDPAHLYPLYILLFTMPGIPSLYYGSEWGISGVKEKWTDAPLRPALDIDNMKMSIPHPSLTSTISRLVQIRKGSNALSIGSYRQIFVDHQLFVFMRVFNGEHFLIALNRDKEERTITLTLPWKSGILRDLLNQGETFEVNAGKADLSIPACWGRILKFN